MLPTAATHFLSPGLLQQTSVIRSVPASNNPLSSSASPKTLLDILLFNYRRLLNNPLHLVLSARLASPSSATEPEHSRRRSRRLLLLQLIEPTHTHSQLAMSNYTLPPLPSYSLEPLPPVVPGIPDKYLTLILPIIAYWGASLFFHCIDEWDLFPQYRLHTPAEVLKRNHVSRLEVFRDVVLQQIVQTIFGIALGLLEEDALVGKEEYDISVWAQRIRVAQKAIPTLIAVAGLDAHGIAKNMAVSHPVMANVLAGGQYQTLQKTALGMAPAFASWELSAAKLIYHVLYPALQFCFAIFVVDTWQYFWHRAMHLNKWLYSGFPLFCDR